LHEARRNGADSQPEDSEIFKTALSGFVGVTYRPNTAASQVVAGMNYRFKCSASIPPALVIWDAIVEIYQPLNGKPYITGVLRA
jgi:hypothetical protein